MKRRLFATLMATLLLERWAGRLLAAQRGGKGVAKKKIVVIGAGMSGLAAARVLHDQGQDVIVLEGRDRLGGRLWTSNKWPDMPVDLGASWIHGTQDNPLTSLADKAKAKQCETSYERSIAYQAGGQELDDAREQQLDRLRSRLGKALRAAQNAEQDVSIRQFITALAKQMDADAETIRLLNFLVSSEMEQEYAGSAERLSTHWFDSAQAFEGQDVLLAQGFQIIVQHLAKGLSIRTNEIVRRVDWSQSAIKVVTESGSFQADKVLLTLPVGVLKAGSVEIVPALPPGKIEAISKLEMGVLNKCCLRFSRVFWPADVDWLQYIPSQDGMWTEWVSFARALEQPILLGFTSGARGRELEGWSDQQIVQSAMQTLRDIFGQSVPNPEAYQITRWGSDRFALGSYSFNPVGTHPQIRRQLAKPVADKLYFAGEATEFDYFGTAHGAYLSGLRAAEEILQ